MTPCTFCGKNPATNHTTESDYVCRDCAIGFELQMQFGDDFLLYEEGKASPELIAKIEAQRPFWEMHFDEQAQLSTDKRLHIIIQEGDQIATAIVSPDADAETFDILKKLMNAAYEKRKNIDNDNPNK